MKLALIALVIEVCLARLIVGSWGWAIVTVVIYCTIVYVRHTVLIRKERKGKSTKKVEGSVFENYVTSNRKRENSLPEIYSKSI